MVWLISFDFLRLVLEPTVQKTRCVGIQKVKCETVQAYLAAVVQEMGRTLSSEDEPVLLWRGQADVAWALAPRLGRDWENDPNQLPRVEKQMFKEFVTSARHLWPTSLDNDWDRLSLAQHYGMRTRLLDWSANPLVALWFALAENCQSDAAVWAFRPKQGKVVYQPTSRQLPFDVKLTSAFRPITHSARVAMQAGWHTVHSFEKGVGLRAIDQMTRHKSSLRLFRIPSKKRRPMLKALEASGISVANIFGDLPSLCASITNRHHPAQYVAARA